MVGPPLSLITAACAAAAALVALFAAAGPAGLLLRVDTHAGSDTVLTLVADNVLLLLSIAVLTPLALFTARVVQRRPAGTLHAVTGRIRWRWLGICMLPAAVCPAALVVAVLWAYDGFAEPLLTIGWPRLLWLAAC